MIDRAELRRVAEAGDGDEDVIVSRRFLKQVAVELDQVGADNRQQQILIAIDNAMPHA